MVCPWKPLLSRATHLFCHSPSSLHTDFTLFLKYANPFFPQGFTCAVISARNSSWTSHMTSSSLFISQLKYHFLIEAQTPDQSKSHAHLIIYYHGILRSLSSPSEIILFVYLMILCFSQQNASFIKWDLGSLIQVIKTVPGT